MIASLLVVLMVQSNPTLDSASVTRLLSQLKTTDSTICRLAGQAMTNYGGLWGWGGWNYSDPGMPMPRPMPTPMPMPGGGGMHFDMHEHSSEISPATLRAFRAFVRDDNRCVRSIAVRMLGNHGTSAEYDLFIGMLKDAQPDIREHAAHHHFQLWDRLGRDFVPVDRAPSHETVEVRRE